MTTLIASPNPTGNEFSLAVALVAAKPGDTVLLRGGDYFGTYGLTVPNVTLAPYQDELPRFTGPAKPATTPKPIGYTSGLLPIMLPCATCVLSGTATSPGCGLPAGMITALSLKRRM